MVAFDLENIYGFYSCPSDVTFLVAFFNLKKGDCFKGEILEYFQTRLIKWMRIIWTICDKEYTCRINKQNVKQEHIGTEY